MNVGVISKRYAKALYMYAKEQEVEDAIYKNMLQLRLLLLDVKYLSVMFKDPLLTIDEKVRKLCDAVGGGEVFEHLMAFVFKASRENLLLFIAHAYIRLYRRDKGILAVRVITASPLTPELKTKIVGVIKQHSNLDVKIKNIVDSSILGGFIIETDDKRFDASVKKQLEEIKKQLVTTIRKLV